MLAKSLLDNRQVPSTIRLPLSPAPFVRFAIATELVVSGLALAVVPIVVALTTSYALGVCWAVEIGGTPIMKTVAAGIQLLPRAAHGDTLDVRRCVQASKAHTCSRQPELSGRGKHNRSRPCTQRRKLGAAALEAPEM